MIEGRSSEKLVPVRNCLPILKQPESTLMDCPLFYVSNDGCQGSSHSFQLARTNHSGENSGTTKRNHRVGIISSSYGKVKRFVRNLVSGDQKSCM